MTKVLISLLQKRLGEIGTPGNNDSIASILDHEEFKCLSENHKDQVFTNYHYTCPSGRSYDSHTSTSCRLAGHDTPTYIQQILPYMPMHTFLSCSLPPGLPWIESEEWMRYMLVKHKVRWNPDSNAGNNDSILQEESDIVDDPLLQNDEDVKTESVNDRDIIHKLRDLAFTILAAKLFNTYCQKDCIRCCEYILSIAPTLVEIRTGPFKVVPLCRALVCDSLAVVNLLLERNAPIGNITQAAYFIFDNAKDSRSFSFIANELKHRANIDEVRLFKDQYGNTLLHVLFSNLCWKKPFKSNILQYIQSCIQIILDYGVDPRVMNYRNETSLDVLINAYVQLSCVYLHDLTEIFMQKLLILPSWGLALPSDFPQPHQTDQDRVVMLCKIGELLDNPALVIRSVQHGALFGLCTPTECQLCLPAVSLVYQAMCKGIDMHSVPGKLSLWIYGWPTIFGLECKDYVSYLLHRLSKAQHHQCCHWALLELLVHCGNDAFSQMDMRNFQGVAYSHVKFLCDFLINLVKGNSFQSRSESYIADKTRSIMVMLRMYYPSILQSVLTELGTVYANNNKRVALLLETMAQRNETLAQVRSFQLLCRLTIRANVAWKDIENLPLPGLLKSYLRIGDIPKSHVIHQIIDEMKVAG